MKAKHRLFPNLRLPALVPAPTVMGSSLVLLCFMLYLVSMQSYSGLLLLILGLLFGVYVINLVEAYRSCRALSFHPPANVTCTEGETLKGTWEIGNETTHATGTASVFSPFGEVLRVGPVEPEDTVHVTPELRLSRRGVYPFRRLHVESTFPFGLIRASRRLSVAGEIVVYPAPYPCAAPPAAGFEPMVGGKFKGKNRSSAGDHFQIGRAHV